MMETQERLIQALTEKFKGESQAAIARRAGLEPPRFNNYVMGIRAMDVDAIIGCAQALGWDVRATVATHLQETGASPRVKAFWRKFATAAMLALCAIGIAGNIAPAKASGLHDASNAYYVRRWWVRLARLWLGRRAKPQGPYIEARL